MHEKEEQNLCDCTGTHLDEADNDRATPEALHRAFAGVLAGFFLFVPWFADNSFRQWPLCDAVAQRPTLLKKGVVMSPDRPMAWRKLIEVAAAAALAPVLLLLVAGRLVFFWAVDALLAVRRAILEIRDTPMPRQAPATLLPFWAAWFLAILLLAGGLAGAILVLNGTERGHLTHGFGNWVLFLVAAGAIFYLALRLALFGTAAMQRAMAHNLALLILSELAVLNAEAEKSEEILAAGGCSPALQMPRFGDEREDIERLFDHPTQSALERLLQSLEAFNSTAIRHEEDFAATLMREQIQDVQARLAQAIATIGPLCTRVPSRARLRSC